MFVVCSHCTIISILIYFYAFDLIFSFLILTRYASEQISTNFNNIYSIYLISNYFIIIYIYFLMLCIYFYHKTFFSYWSIYYSFITVFCFNDYWYKIYFNIYVNTYYNWNNIYLLNSYVYVHPPLLFLTWVVTEFLILENLHYWILIIFLLKKTIHVKIVYFLIWVVLVALVLGGFWAENEGTWGGFWAWDYSECLSLNVFILLIILWHFMRRKKILKVYFIYLFLHKFIFTQIYFYTKYFLVNSSHNFGNIFLLFMHIFSVYCIYLCVYLIILKSLYLGYLFCSLCNGSINQNKNVNNRVFFFNKFKFILLLILFYSNIYVNLDICMTLVIYFYYSYLYFYLNKNVYMIYVMVMLLTGVYFILIQFYKLLINSYFLKIHNYVCIYLLLITLFNKTTIYILNPVTHNYWYSKNIFLFWCTSFYFDVAYTIENYLCMYATYYIKLILLFESYQCIYTQTATQLYKQIKIFVETDSVTFNLYSLNTNYTDILLNIINFLIV